MRRMLVASAALAAALVTPACYRAHLRAADDASVDDRLDAPPHDGSTDALALPDAPPPLGCRARCEPPSVRVLASLPALLSGAQSYELIQAVSVEDTIVVLTSARFPGYAAPLHRLLFVEPGVGTFRVSEPWAGASALSSHHRGARIVQASREGLTVITPVGLAHLEGGIPSGTQTVTLRRLTWSFDGTLETDERISTPVLDETLACVGACEAGIAYDDTHAVVTYAPDGVLYQAEIPFSTLRASEWRTLGPIGDGAAAPWPHMGVLWEAEHWIAGGGTPDLSEPRTAFLYAPDRTTLPLDGSDGDLPPLLLSGRSLAIARHVRGASSSFHVQRLRPGEPLEVIRVSTGTIGALAAALAHDADDRLVLAWSSLAPGTLRDTLVSVVPDTPFDRCDVVEPTEVARIPQGIVAPTVLAHAHDDRLFVMAVTNDTRGRSPELVVFELAGCRLEE